MSGVALDLLLQLGNIGEYSKEPLKHVNQLKIIRLLMARIEMKS